MLAVGADDEIKGTAFAPLERHVHAAGVVGDRGDRVAEDVLGSIHSGFVQDAGQVAAEHLDVATGLLGGHPGERKLVPIDEDRGPSANTPR